MEYGETRLHKEAKTLLIEEGHLMLPTVIARYAHLEETVRAAQDVSFSNPRPEAQVDGIRADLTVEVFGRSLLVEVFVTHPCSDRKLALIRSRKLPCVEIDLSGLPRDASSQVLREAVLRSAPRCWLFNALVEHEEARLRREVMAQGTIDRMHLDATIRDWSARLRREKVSTPSTQVDDSGSVSRVVNAGLQRLLGCPIAGDGCFSASQDGWQAMVLDLVILTPGSPWYNAPGLVELLGEKGCLKRIYADLLRTAPSSVVEGISAKLAGFRPPKDVVEDYLIHMKNNHLVRLYGSGWLVNGDLALRSRVHLGGQGARHEESWLSAGFGAIGEAATKGNRGGNQSERAERWRRRLLCELKPHFRSREQAELWATSAHPRLEMRRPVEACLDEPSYRSCVALLPRLRSAPGGADV